VRPSPHSRSEARRTSLEQTIQDGALAGVLAALPAIALLLLAAASYLDVGAVTPLYNVIGLLAPEPLLTALDALQRGEDAPFLQHPFTAGLAMCLLLGAVSGTLFAIGVSRRSVRNRIALVLIGPLHGLFCMSIGLGVLFTLARLTDSEWIAESLVATVGWPTLIVVHVVFGAVLSLCAMRWRATGG
jgi:hypothetical protein